MSNDLRIDIERLQTRLADLAAIGEIKGTEGSARLALTDEDKAGRDLVVAWMRDLDLDVTIDAIGNAVAIMPGEVDGPPVMCGSHIDTVRTGGRYDGNLGVLAGLTWFIAVKCDPVERSRMIVLLILTVSTVVFWALFEQSAASMTLFADRVMDRELLGIQWTAAQFGSLNALFIFTLAPLFAWLWASLGRRQLEPSTPVKFALGIAQAGLGFGALVIGASMPDEAGLVAGWWMVLAYLLHTTGELCLSPVGLSAVTKLAVPSVVGVMMGAWFLATAYSEYVAAQLSKLAAVQMDQGQVTDLAAALATYTELFTSLLWIGLAVGGALLLISPLLRRMMRGVH